MLKFSRSLYLGNHLFSHNKVLLILALAIKPDSLKCMSGSLFVCVQFQFKHIVWSYQDSVWLQNGAQWLIFKYYLTEVSCPKYYLTEV